MKTTGPVGHEPVALMEQSDLEGLQRAVADPQAAAPTEIQALQMTAGNRAVQRQGGDEGFQLHDETAGRINHQRGGGQPLEGSV